MQYNDELYYDLSVYHLFNPGIFRFIVFVTYSNYINIHVCHIINCYEIIFVYILLNPDINLNNLMHLFCICICYTYLGYKVFNESHVLTSVLSLIPQEMSASYSG